MCLIVELRHASSVVASPVIILVVFRWRRVGMCERESALGVWVVNIFSGNLFFPWGVMLANVCSRSIVYVGVSF